MTTNNRFEAVKQAVRAGDDQARRDAEQARAQPAAMPTPGVPRTRILVGDVRRVLATLPAKSVHCIVTSPPYWGLRDYKVPPSVWGGDSACDHEWGATQRAPWANDVPGPNSGGKNAGFRNHIKDTGPFCAKCGAWRGCLGLEPTVELFLDNLVAVFRDCWRVLRDDGTLWLNIGDSYAGSGRGPTGANGIGQHERRQGFHSPGASHGVRAKSMMLIPERLLLALQADGWIVRDKVVWHKTSAMPENVRDRCSDAWEPVYQLTKRGRYFADMEAVKQPPSASTAARAYLGQRPLTPKQAGFQANGFHQASESLSVYDRASANLRNVWSLGPEPLRDIDHYAAFPTELPRRCIKIGTSERGVCPTCGAPWVRVVERAAATSKKCPKTDGIYQAQGGTGEKRTGTIGMSGGGRIDGFSVTVGWQPSCACGGEPIPATVLDPFGGVMTTALVANQLGRDSISIELGPKYAAMGARRIQDDAGMLCDITIEEMP